MDAVWIGLLQWPAMIVTIAATYFVASKVTWKPPFELLVLFG